MNATRLGQVKESELPVFVNSSENSQHNPLQDPTPMRNGMDLNDMHSKDAKKNVRQALKDWKALYLRLSGKESDSLVMKRSLPQPH